MSTDTDADTGTDTDTGPSAVERVAIDAGAITVARWGDGEPEIVMAHDGLGSIEQWRAIPARIAAETGRTVMAYDRPGHGTSTPFPTGPWPADWLHTEAHRLGRLLVKLGIRNPLLVGHSDGGSIVLLLAAALGDPATAPFYEGLSARGVLTLASHTWVEIESSGAIVEMRENPKAFAKGLAPHHVEPERVFEAWSGVWVSDSFAPWDIRPMLSTISCPALVTQGVNDEYATESQVTDTAAAIGENADHRLLDGVGHLLHHQNPDLVVDVVSGFDRSLT